MGRINKEALIKRINVLQGEAPDIQAAAVVSLDGLIIASALPETVSEDRVSAMSAAMLSLGEQINKEVGLGSLEQLYTRGSNGYVILMAVGSEAVLTVLARPEAKLGIMLLKLRKAAEDLVFILQPPMPESVGTKPE